MRVAVFTDNNFEKTNGVTTTLKAMLKHAPSDVRPRVYTHADLRIDEPDYLALRSVGVPIPFYGEMLMYAPRLRALTRHLQRDEVGVIHLTTPGPVGLAARYLAWRMQVPLVGSFHTHLAEYTAVLSGSSSLGACMAHYLRWTYGTCQPVLVPSADTRTRLEADGWDTTRLQVWSRGVDAKVFAPGRRSAALRERWGVSDRRPAVLYAGRLSREKGLSLIETIDSSLYRRHAAHRWVLVGDGPMAAELKERCPDAVFTGRLSHDDVAVAMASADLFVFPSTTDTAGNVVLEAQACGLPVLVSDKGGPMENMQPNITGFVCTAGDASTFAARAVDLLTAPGLRTDMSKAARRYAESRSWEASLRPLYETYRAAVTSASPVNRRGLGPLRDRRASASPGTL